MRGQSQFPQCLLERLGETSSFREDENAIHCLALGLHSKGGFFFSNFPSSLDILGFVMVDRQQDD